MYSITTQYRCVYARMHTHTHKTSVEDNHSRGVLSWNQFFCWVYPHPFAECGRPQGGNAISLQHKGCLLLPDVQWFNAVCLSPCWTLVVSNLVNQGFIVFLQAKGSDMEVGEWVCILKCPDFSLTPSPLLTYVIHSLVHPFILSSFLLFLLSLSSMSFFFSMCCYVVLNTK